MNSIFNAMPILFWLHIHKLSKQTNKNDWTKCDQIYQIDHQIIFAHSWSHTDLLITRFFDVIHHLNYIFTHLNFYLIVFLHLIFGSFVHCHTHIVHICNYFPSIDVNKYHSIKQNKKKIYSHLKCLSFLGECFLSCLDIVRYSPVCVSSFFAIWFTSTLLLIQKQNIQLALFSLIPFSWRFKNGFFLNLLSFWT